MAVITFVCGCEETYRQVEHVGQLCQPIQHKGYQGEGHICAQDAERCDGAKVPEELLLLHRQPRVKDDGRQQIPAGASKPQSCNVLLKFHSLRSRLASSRIRLCACCAEAGWHQAVLGGVHVVQQS